MRQPSRSGVYVTGGLCPRRGESSITPQSQSGTGGLMTAKAHSKNSVAVRLPGVIDPVTSLRRPVSGCFRN
jgi:hypothetical protein